jgi:hypothetical protein
MCIFVARQLWPSRGDQHAARGVRCGVGHERLRPWAASQALHCQVSDDGPAPRTLPARTRRAWRREHGHRLWIIGQVSLNRTPSRTTVTVTISSRLGKVDG